MQSTTRPYQLSVTASRRDTSSFYIHPLLLMATVVFAGCTGGMGSILLDRLNRVQHESSQRSGGIDASPPTPSFLQQPIRHLILIDFFRDEAAQKAARERCHASIVRLDAIHWDASNDANTLSMLEELEKVLRHGTLDLLIVTTGMGFHGELKHSTMSASSSVLNKLLKVNAVGPALLVQFCASKMEASLAARNEFAKTNPAAASKRSALPLPTILIISSYSGVVGLPHRAAYCASKFALNGYVESVAAEFSTVRYVLVCPTSVATNFRDNWKKQIASESSSGDGASPAPAVEVNAPQLTTEQCVEGIWSALTRRRTKPGVEYDILPKGKSQLAFAASRLPLGIGSAVRKRINRASSKL